MEAILERSEPVVLELYNNTGETITGYHYDPVFLIVEYNPRSRTNGNRATSCGSKTSSAASAQRIEQKGASQPQLQPPPPPEKHIQQMEAAVPSYKDTEDLAEDFLRNLEWPEALTPLVFRWCD